MSKWKNALWWCCFIIMAICIQALAPGLDVMAVGLIIILQENDYHGIIWLLPLFILLQEGIGTRPFGSVIVWYSATIIIFKLGRWLLKAENFVFMFMLSACLGCAYYAVEMLMAPLQNLTFNIENALDKSLSQAIFMPFAWLVFSSLRPHGMAEEDSAGNS